MSWYRIIKSLLTICVGLFLFIIFSIIGSLFFGYPVDYRVFLIALAAIFLMQLIISRIKNKYLALALPIILCIGVLFFIKGLFTISNIIFILLSVALFFSLDEEAIDYELYKYRASQAVMTIVVIGIVLPFMSKELSTQILKLYIMFLFMVIMLLRETRAYYFKLRKKNAGNTVFFGGTILLVIFFDKIYPIVTYIGIYLYKAYDFIVKYIMSWLFLLFGRLAQFIITILHKIFGKKFEKVAEEYFNKGNKLFDMAKREVPIDNTEVNPTIILIAKLVIIIIIIFIVYRVIYRYFIYSRIDTSGMEEHKDKIKIEKRRLRDFIRSVADKILKPSDLRSQILHVFKKFELKTNEIGIFKSHLTATQLGNITKTKVEEADAINQITSIYNETKFSNHAAQDEKLTKIKESYDNLKDKL